MLGSGPFQLGSPILAANVPSPPPTAPVTANTALARSANRRVAIDSSGGTFTVTFPASPNIGDIVGIEDWGNAVGTTPVTLSAGTAKLQNPHTGSLSASTYSFGSNEGSGSTSSWTWASDSLETPTTFWKVI